MIEPNPTRRLVDLAKLATNYNQETLWINYKDHSQSNGRGYIEIPLNMDLFMRLRAWIAYDRDTDDLIISQNIMGGPTYWLTQLLDDHKNKRIDITKYIHDYKTN